MMGGYIFLPVLACVIQLGLVSPFRHRGFTEPIKACIIGNDIEVINNVTLEECKQKCSHAKFNCYSLEYIPKISECHLADVHKMHKSVQESGAFKAPCPDLPESLYMQEKPMCVGCPVPTSVDSSDVLLAAKSAVQGLAGSAALGSSCGGISLVKVEKAARQLVNGENYHLTLRLEIITGKNCQEKIEKICKKIVVHQPRSCKMSQDGCLQLAFQDGISCSEIKESRTETDYEEDITDITDAPEPEPEPENVADITDAPEPEPENVRACSEPFAVPGDCFAKFRRWSYIQETGQCKEFLYGGCEGNNNNFDSKQSCADTCEKSDYEEDIADSTDAPEPEPEPENVPDITDASEPEPENDNPCTEPFAVHGPCKAIKGRWSYNQDHGICHVFYYGGCEGNKNNFRTKHVCADTCEKSGKDCSEPFAVPGPCNSAFPRWSYNQETGECEKFMYGGCGGNNNRFPSKKGCAKTCKKAGETLFSISSKIDSSKNPECTKEGRSNCQAITINRTVLENLKVWEKVALLPGMDIELTLRIWGGSTGPDSRTRPIGYTFDIGNDGLAEISVAPDSKASQGSVQGEVVGTIYPVSESKAKKESMMIYEIINCGSNCTVIYETETGEWCSDAFAVVGTGGSSIPRWSYNQETGKCESFRCKGCMDSKNSFYNKESCTALCEKTG